MKAKNAAPSFATLVANKPAKTKVAGNPTVTLTQEQFEALIAAAKGNPVATIPTPAAKPVHVAPVTEADFTVQGKITECYRAARAHEQAVAPWNGKRGKEGVGGKFSPEGIAAFKAGYNAKAKELGIPTKY